MLLPLDVLLRHNARILDPVTAAQPNDARRERDNGRAGRPDERSPDPLPAHRVRGGRDPGAGRRARSGGAGQHHRCPPTGAWTRSFEGGAPGPQLERRIRAAGRWSSSARRRRPPQWCACRCGRSARPRPRRTPGPCSRRCSILRRPRSPRLSRPAPTLTSRTDECGGAAGLRDRDRTQPPDVRRRGRRGRLQCRALRRRGRLQRRSRLQRRTRNRHGGVRDPRAGRSGAGPLAGQAPGPAGPAAAGRWWRSWTPGWPSIPGSTAMPTTRWSPGCATTTTLRNVEPATLATGGEPDPNLIDPLEGLIDPFFGHGTFIAGLIRQVCPDANILSVKVMGTDGIVEEAELITRSDSPPAPGRGPEGRRGRVRRPVDVLSLSLGYYHEAGAAGEATTGCCGTRSKPSVGSGVWSWPRPATTPAANRCCPPASPPFTEGTLPGGTRTRCPLVSVGALNPDGSVALFSNSGSWVSCYSPGAALVSTLPVVDSRPARAVGTGFAPPADRPVASWRATIDPDNFTGFGTWSGTSFAAPVAAAARRAGPGRQRNAGQGRGIDHAAESRPWPRCTSPWWCSLIKPRPSTRDHRRLDRGRPGHDGSRSPGRRRNCWTAGVAASEIGKLTEAVDPAAAGAGHAGAGRTGRAGRDPDADDTGTSDRRLVAAPGCCSAWRSPSTSWA